MVTIIVVTIIVDHSGYIIVVTTCMSHVFHLCWSTNRALPIEARPPPPPPPPPPWRQRLYDQSVLKREKRQRKAQLKEAQAKKAAERAGSSASSGLPRGEENAAEVEPMDEHMAAEQPLERPLPLSQRRAAVFGPPRVPAVVG